MFAGQETKQVVTAMAAQILVNLRNSSQDEEKFYKWLSAQQDADLTALGFGPDDITDLRGAFDDQHLLAVFANGGPDPGKPSGYDFTAYATQVIGPSSG